MHGRERAPMRASPTRHGLDAGLPRPGSRTRNQRLISVSQARGADQARLAEKTASLQRGRGSGIAVDARACARPTDYAAESTRARAAEPDGSARPADEAAKYQLSADGGRCPR